MPDEEPTTTAQALKNPKWKGAMDAEFDALLHNQTWHLVPKPKGKNIIGCKWVYKIKRRADGTIDRYKARLVAKGTDNDMESTMKIHTAQSLRLPPFRLYSQLLCRVVGHYGN